MAAGLPAYRAPDRKGVGIFEQIGGDLSLIRPGLEHSDTDALKEVKELCIKIYRATNTRYQTIAKLIMRNRGDELRQLI